MKDEKTDVTIDTMKGTPDFSPASSLHFNADEYRDDLAELELTTEQETELLQTLWNIMATFVDLGWGVDGVQAVLPELFDKVAQDSDKLLDSTDTQDIEKKREE